MANFQKYAKGAIGHLGKHYERGLDGNNEPVKYGNQSINPERSHLNYNLAPERKISQSEYVRQRTNEVQCLNRKDVKVMCSWVVTKPKDLPQEQEKAFFEQTYKFLENRYGGEKNVVSAFVHMDENQPHLHFAFVPVVTDKKKGIEKVSAKECVDRKELQTFHKDLSKHMEHYFGHDIGIINEATREGNKSIEELKRQSAIERLQEVQEKANEIICKAQERAKALEHTLAPVRAEYEAKKVFIDKCVESSDVSMMYPSWAEVSKKGFIKKQEFVTVPKEKWEEKHVSANQIDALKKEREALEKAMDTFKKSDPAKKIETLQGEIGELKEKNLNLTKKLERASHNVDRVNKVFKEYPDIKNQFVQAEKAMEKALEKVLKKTLSRGFDMEL